MRVYRHQEKMLVEINQYMLASFDEIEERVRWSPFIRRADRAFQKEVTRKN
jgi:hypothetical protein